MALLLQFLGSVLLFAGIAWGYQHWIKPHNQLSFQARGLLLLVILTLMGGLFGAPAWWLDDPRAFSWDLPPLAGRLLGTAAWSFAVVSFMALQRPTYQRLRLVLILLSVYLTPLLVAALVFHVSRFDFSASITYGFFAVVLIMVPASLWYLWRQPIIIPETLDDLAPPNAVQRGWLMVIAGIMGLWGLALFISDAGASDLIWAWPGDLLTSRLIGVMLLALAASALYSLRAAALARMMNATLLVYGIGVTIANLWNLLGGKPPKLAYLFVFAMIALVSGVMLWAKGFPGLQSLTQSGEA